MKMVNTIRSVVTGYGSYLPSRVMDNNEMAKLVDTSDEWIRERTGISQRHIAADGEFTSNLAAKAAEKALNSAGITSDEIDLIVLATTTPDNTFPSTATRVQALLGCNKGAAFDIQAVCTGFVYALATADNFIKAGQCKKALVIGADVLTRILDWEDRSTCILFGDGAGAVVLEATENTNCGILSTNIHSDGRTRDLLYVDGGVSSTQTAGAIRMSGREVFRHAVQKMTDSTSEALEKAGLSKDNVDWLIPHQANQRILDSAVKKMQLPKEKLIATVDNHANTSAASIPLAIDFAVRDGRIQKNDILAISAIGGGLTWGAAIIKW